jgi:ribonucleoside-diphosphate reductase alpha chain
MSKCRRTGRRPPPTSSPASISTASWARPSANAASPNWCIAWSTPSPTGARGRYFATPDEDGENFRDELAHLMLTQKACFNSPVWFNVGVKEARGYGWSTTRSRRHQEAGRAKPAAMLGLLHRFGEGFARIHSGPGQDRGHAVQVGLGHRHQSCRRCAKRRHPLGRRARLRAALLHEGLRRVRRRDQIRRQDAARGQDGDPQRDHPDIERFIWCKAKEEKKAHTLIEAGYDSSLDGDAYSSIFFQNANNSVRATDEFMEAVTRGSRLVDQVRPPASP